MGLAGNLVGFKMFFANLNLAEREVIFFGALWHGISFEILEA